MCKAKRMTCAELEDKIIDHAKRCKKYKPNAAIREHEASMKYERLMRERRAIRCRPCVLSLVWPICRSWWAVRYRLYRWNLKATARNIRWYATKTARTNIIMMPCSLC